MFGLLAGFNSELASMPFRVIGNKKCNFSFLIKSISYMIYSGGTAVYHASAQQNGLFLDGR
jgi:hypothetical protein